VEVCQTQNNTSKYKWLQWCVQSHARQTLGFRFKPCPQKIPPINNHPTYYNCNVNKFGVPSWTDCPCSRKTLGFPTEESTGKLLLKRMASDH